MKLLKRSTNLPSGGYSRFIHIVLTAALPVACYILVRLDFGWVAILLVLLSKWRMLAVKLRHWPANIRANAVDIFVGISFVIFMIESDTQALQLVWAALYAFWLLFVKRRSTTIWVGVQALLGQSLSLVALYLHWPEASTFVFVAMTWLISYFSARHFLSAFDESMAQATANAWAFFAAAVAWLGGHWLIFHGPIAQPALLISVLSYGLASIYYLEHVDKLTSSIRWQFVGVMTAVVLFLIIFSDWSDKTI